MNSEYKIYRLVNLILAGIISLVFIYSGIFSYEKANHPIPSFHKEISGEETISNGLSRSFSAIVRLEFEIAHQYNVYGVRLFLFFLAQFLLRFLFLILASRYLLNLKKVMFIDVVLSTIMFLIHFEPYIREAVYR